MPITIRNEQKKVAVNPAKVRKLLQKCLQCLNYPDADVSVLLTGDGAIRHLNREHRGQDRPTDVLSFGMREQRRANEPLPPHPEVLGDVVVSMPTIQRQAKARKVTVQEELDFILIHGLLHLLGYDHAAEAEKRRMDALHHTLFSACRER
jgi:probable rRNA maturation factor